MSLTDDGVASTPPDEQPRNGASPTGVAAVDGPRRPAEPTGPTGPAGRADRRHPLRWWRRGLIAAWLAAIVVFLVRFGVPVDRETIIGFTVVGLLVWSLGRRPLRSVFVDWLPFVAVLLVYDYTRGAADLLGSPTQWLWQIDVDRVIGLGTVPTTWLQEHLKQAQPPLWEVGVSLVYISFYFVPYLVAGWLWLRGRADFRQFAVRFVTLSFLGVVCFVVVPAAPPWAAAQCHAAQVVDHPLHPACMHETSMKGAPDNGLLGHYVSATDSPSTAVDRVSSRGFASLHLPNAQELLDKGQASVNLVAAIPSLHAATTLMLSMFLWPRVRRRWRPLLVAYPPAMAFTLVYSGEHYVTDILVGWLLALVLEFAVRQWVRRRGTPSAHRTQPAGARGGTKEA